MQKSQYTSKQIQNNDKGQRSTTNANQNITEYDGYIKIEGTANPQSWRNRGFTTKQNDIGHCDNMDAMHATATATSTTPSITSIQQRGQSNITYVLYNDNNNAVQNNATPLAQLLYSEDLRISKILRRLLTENNPTAASSLCKKLESAVRNQANTIYICRSFDFLMESMLMVLKQCPEECLQQASIVLGLMGYINRNDFGVYKNGLMRAYQGTPQIQKYIMLALKTTLNCDAVNLDLLRHSERLLQTLKDYLENSEVADNFITISNTIAEFSKNYKRSFEMHFTDIVDIIVGWHLEIEQPTSLKQHCSQVLQQFSSYFIKNLKFTLGLLGQFLEDIAGFSDDIIADGLSKQQQLKIEQRIGAFIGAFNSILKCLATRTEFFEICDGVVKMLHEALAIVVKVTKQNFSLKLATEETILNVNDLLCFMIENCLEMVDLQCIKVILELELQLCDKFNESEQLSMLFIILCLFKKLKTNLPKSFVTLILQDATTNPLTMIKLAQQQRTYRLLLRIYHEILIIKNVPLLQEAYYHVSLDIKYCIDCLKQRGNDYETRKSEALLSFYLAALSALATQTSSIISIYALSPSILELLISNFEAANLDLWCNYSTLHEALLSLLLVHCQKNHNFRPTSRLLNEQDAGTYHSPTIEHFSLILKFVANILQNSAKLNVASLNLLLNWLDKLLKACAAYSDVLAKQEQFQAICKSLCLAAKKSPLHMATCLSTLLMYPELPMHILEEIRNICLQMLDSLDADIRTAYTSVYAQLPLAISLCPRTTEYIHTIRKQQQRYNANSTYAPLRQKYFKTFLEHLDPEQHTNAAVAAPSSSGNDNVSSTSGKTEKYINNLLLEFFKKSCCHSPNDEHCQVYQQNTQHSIQLLTMWLQFEAARYCVQNKLRTVIGKPQETFLAIEAVIMKYGRSLHTKQGGSISSTQSNSDSLYNLVATQCKIRLLLGFLENLEKLIYNAAEGTAFAIAPAEKPAKTFFRINAQTCNEWFKRIRNGVCLIGLHSQEPEMVIRYAECILNLDKLNEPAMEHILLTLVAALLQCSESDTIEGLFARIKQQQQYQQETLKRYSWIQCVAEQAAGHQEVAAEGYHNYLIECGTQVDSRVKDFLRQQQLECLYYTGQWAMIREIREITNSELTTMTLRSYNQLAQMEKICEQYVAASEPNDTMLTLTQWSDGRDLKHVTSSLNNCSIFNILNYVEEHSLNGVIAEEKEKCAIQLALQESLLHGEHSHFNEFVILNHVQQRTYDVCSVKKLHANRALINSKTLLKCLLWSLDLEQKIPCNLYSSSLSGNLLLDVAANARADGNKKFCSYLLEQFMCFKGYQAPLHQVVQQLHHEVLQIDVTDMQLMQGFLEIARMYSQQSPTHLSEAIDMTACVAKQILLYNQQVSYATSTAAICAEMLLNMAESITQRSAGTSVQSEHLAYLLPQLPQLPVALNDAVTNIIPEADFAAGTLLNASVWQADNVADNWYAFGNWCYRWGKKIIEPNSAEQQQGKLTPRDIEDIRNLVGSDTNDISTLLTTLNKFHLNINDGIEEIITNDCNSTEQLEQELQNLPILAAKPGNIIASIIQIWCEAHKSVYSYYELATKAYFRYLAIKTEGENSANTVANSHVEDSTFVTTTLRLLRLIVKHAIGLQDVLEEGLSNTPLRPWKIIIPQLFSRLNHHEPYVRKCVSELLCRLAGLHSHLILFPAVVGAQQQQQSETEATTRLSSCFSTLLQTLTLQAPDAVRHVQLLVKELKRITLLWEEYWLHALSQIYSDYSPLINALDVECKKSRDYALDRLEAKYNIIMQHVIADIEKLVLFTSRTAETNYERNFQDRFTPYINETISALKAPFEREKVSETWLKIKQLYNVFQHRSLRGSNSTLKVSELSPILANMSNTAIAMPGVDTNDQLQIHIKSVDHVIHILPTKTKPKKLAFYGSNGRKYTYLFKGLEDLHLDERIMQFLSISNSMMARSSTHTLLPHTFKAQHYSVIPLGPQSGLISWVDGVTPIFAIYKKWQQRDALLKQQQKDRIPNKQQAGNTDQQQQQASITPTATRPSELFYNKLTPLLAAQRIKVTDPRKQWPLATLRQVFNELSQETPKDLVAKEIWCHSINAAEWRRAVRKYSISVAVMSVIGYVIGLGDRHLDNVLIKLTTGEVVHIDYNVCFEKGKTLRIPEKVPFRMTQNLETALGITGVEGAFRLSCEHVLKVLRKEKETLLTLLEAFVYDPLVDWTVSDDGSTTNMAATGATAVATTTTRPTTAYLAAQQLSKLNQTYAANTTNSKEIIKLNKFNYTQKKPDLELARQNIILRFNEIKPSWRKYKEDLCDSLLRITNEIDELLVMRKNLQEFEKERNSRTKQLALIGELEALGSAMGSHALNTLTQRYSNYKANNEAMNYVKQSMQQQQSNIQNLLSTYFDKLISNDAIGKLMSMQIELNEEQQKTLINEFSLVADLLQQRDQQLLYENCDFARREMNNALNQETHALLECFELLLQYANVMQYYARKKIQNNALVHYEQAYRKILQSQSTNLDEHMLASLISNEKQNIPDYGRVVKYANAMSVVWNKLNFNLQKALKELKEHKQQMLMFEEYTTDIVKETLISSSAIYIEYFQMVMLHKLSEAQKSLVAYEVSSYEGNAVFDVLEQQMNNMTMLENITELIFAESSLPEETANFYSLKANLQNILAMLYKLKCSFELSFSERILHLFMLDDNMELQALLEEACTANFLHSLFESDEGEQQTCCNALLTPLLRDIYELFAECEANICSLIEAVHQLHYSGTLDGHQVMSPDEIPKHLKYEAIAELFFLLKEYAASLKEQELEMVYDVKYLLTPLKRYLTCVQKTKLIGLTAIIYEELEKCASACIPRRDNVDESTMDNIQTLFHKYFLAEQQNCLFQQHQRRVLCCTKSLDHYTLVATAFYWQHMEYMQEYEKQQEQQQLSFPHIIPRENLLASLLSNTQTLAAWKHTITKIQSDIEAHVFSIELQLNWQNNNDETLNAALCENFMECSALQKQHYEFHLNMLQQMCDYALVLLQFERYTAFGQQLEAEQIYQTLLAKYQEASDKWQQSDAIITPVEQSIVELLDPEGKIDQCWIRNISGLLDDMIYTVQKRIAQLERDEQDLCEQIQAEGQQLQTLLDMPVRLDVRYLIKSIFKNEKNSRVGGDENITATTQVREFHQSLKLFFNQISDLRLKLLAGDCNEHNLQHVKDFIISLLAVVEDNHDGFLQAMHDFIENNNKGESTQTPETLNAAINNADADKKLSSSNGEQKRNAYAVSVWKRIRMKLEGRDPDSTRRASIAEQVDYIICESLNVDNLAVLYEGWTPWV